MTDSKENLYKYLRGERDLTVSLSGGPVVSFLPKLFLNWSLPINFVTWYVFTVNHPDITITDWERVYKECLIKPKN